MYPPCQVWGGGVDSNLTPPPPNQYRYPCHGGVLPPVARVWHG